MFKFLISDEDLLEEIQEEMEELTEKTLNNFSKTDKHNIFNSIAELYSDYFMDNLFYYLNEEYVGLNEEIEKIRKKLLTK